MGNFRSRSGCLTCRARRVKCDETRPVCIACSKKHRPCRWDAPFTKFRDYQPDASPATTADGVEGDRSESEDFQMDLDAPDMVDGSMDSRVERPTPSHSDSTTSTSQPSSRSFKHSPSSPLLLSGRREPPVDTPAEIARPQQLLTGQTRAFSHAPISLTREEASMVHHYSEYLGRWLDCTDATRQFTLGIPLKVKSCHVLLNAVQSFAACHRGDVAAAGITYQHCIALLIERLNEDSASHDETLLCAIVILRFVEQLNVPSSTGSDDEQHLAGCSAIIRTSQGHHYVDPSAPSLREAAFWVYVRQCLYNATINQQPPDIDLSLRLHPPPSSMHNSHPLAHLRLETAWANQMTWYTACVVNFCFEGSEAATNLASKSNNWEVLWQNIETWARERPSPFDPIYEGKTDPSAVFADIWFTADWHVMSYGFYHFSCILLLTYKPGPKFANRSARRHSDTDQQILEHARAICGACKSSPETVPISITLCHTVFIWGPLLTDPVERDEVVGLLTTLETDHRWPTTWIVNALNNEWISP